MDKQVELKCRECFECQLVSAPVRPDPISSTRMPDHPWQHIACDILGPLPNGDHVFVVVDYYSRYFEVAFLRTVTSRKIIEVCDTMFSRWGIPSSVRTDNGPQFGKEFQAYLQENGIFWMSTTPMWPQANGEVERQNRSLLKSLKIANLSGRDYKAELRKFLMAYRSTPHSVTGVSPAELMLGRPMKTKLPSIMQGSLDESVRDRQELAQWKSREYTNSQRNAVNKEIEVGDSVLVRSPKTNKLSPTYEVDKFQVVAKEGSEVVVGNDVGKQMRRNVTDVRPLINSETSEAHANAGGDNSCDESNTRPTRQRRYPERYGVAVEH